MNITIAIAGHTIGTLIKFNILIWMLINLTMLSFASGFIWYIIFK